MKSILVRFVYYRLLVFMGSVGFSLVAYILARLIFNLD
jgi:phage shock protein PspC (stress-responsive transcriptional regulator)